MASRISKKNAEQEIAKLEGFVPVNKEDIKYAIEIPVKERQIEKVEKVGESRIKKPRKKQKETSAKSSGYTLIITEKPQAAMKIANALGNAREYKEGGASYYELVRDGEKITVAAAVGHLFNLIQDKGEKGWPVFKISWKASDKNPWQKKYLNLLKSLCKQASNFIVATDYDIEGEVIGWNIIRFICKQKDAKRMKFSTLTNQELEQAYQNLMQNIDWGQAIAGETRHYLDWLYGINLSRALMEAIKTTGSFRIMSIGRVQGPALNFIVQREKEISSFKPEPYWQVFIIVEGTELKYVKDLTKKSELIPFQNLKGKKVEVKTEISEQAIKPPAPFDLTTLQTEAYKFFSINPAKTLQIAQRLYLAGLISYPRTSSQKIPDSIQPLNIIKKLSKEYNTKLCTRSKPIEGSKSDPAHPSIYPTGETSSLAGEDKKIYDLIARRFLSCFCDDALVENKTISAFLDSLKFVARGLNVKKKGWLDMYKAKMQEKKLRDIQGTRIIEEARIEEKLTQPPRRYTPASLISELTKRNLGTKATRASIVETLYNRGYVKEQSIKATPLGISLIDTLNQHCPIIIDEALTRKFEKEMENIQTAKKNLEEKENKILAEAKETITQISNKFKKEEREIGLELVKATNNLREEERKENELILCPKCKKGKLRILYNKKSARYFVACSAYPECKTTFSLPPRSLIKKSDKICEHCNFPKLLAIRKAKRPWEFCFNPECKSNQMRS